MFIGSDEDYESSSDEEMMTDKPQQKSGFFGSLKSSFMTFTGGKVLTEEDLQPILEQFSQQLMSKNVAQEISHQLCESIKAKLLSTKSQRFTQLKTTVRESMQQTLTKILTPKREIDLLMEVNKCKRQGRPYVVTFIGVNGVGKSTTLSKVAYMLKN